MRKIISLLTDFGLKSPYVAQVKATLLQYCPDAILIDITHQVEKHNIVEGAYLLEMSIPYFPAGTMHLAIVDPGVGSERLPIVVECQEGSVLVGPDNGLLTLASQILGVKGAYRIESSSFKRGRVSSTFHGRDVFAIAAARIANGASPPEAGSRVRGLSKLDLPRVYVSTGRLECFVVHVDVFGNVITNARIADLKKAGFKLERMLRLKWKNGASTARLTGSYYKVGKGKFMVLEGSQGYVEVACREEDASKRMNVKSLDKLALSG